MGPGTNRNSRVGHVADSLTRCWPSWDIGNQAESFVMHLWKRILLSLLIASITFFYPLLAPTPHRIDQAHADLITKGMPREQVEAIFGVPSASRTNSDRFTFLRGMDATPGCGSAG